MEYLDSSYEKWLVILHLYSSKNYTLLLKYMQRELFKVKEEEVQFFLRFNLFVVYLLI